MAGIFGKDVDLFHVCDIEPACLQLLLARRPAVRPKHVFQDMLTRWPAQAVQSLEENGGGSGTHPDRHFQRCPPGRR